MAVTTGSRTFWGALLSVLLKCIAALRFIPATRTAAAAPASTAGAATATGTAAGPASAAERAASADRAPAADRAAGALVPEPRARLPYLPHIPQQSRRRSRTLPPTMKQRISAEAHGSSPSVRSLSGDGLLPEGRYAGSVTIAAPEVAADAAADAAPRA